MSEDSSERSRLASFVRLAFAVAFLAWVAYFIIQHQDEFQLPRPLAASAIVALIVAFLLQLLCSAVAMRQLLRQVGTQVPSVTCIALCTSSAFLNLLLPARGGAALRAAWLHRHYSLTISNFVATLAAFYLMHACVNGLAGLSAMVALSLSGTPPGTPLTAVFIVTATGSASLLFLHRAPFVRTLTRRVPILNRLFEGWQIVCGNPRLVGCLILVVGTSTLISVWQAAVVFEALDLRPDRASLVVYASARNLSTFIGLTPGALGVTECVSIYLGTLLNYTTAQALIFQGLMRGVSLLTLAVAGPVALATLRGSQRRSTTIASH